MNHQSRMTEDEFLSAVARLPRRPTRPQRSIAAARLRLVDGLTLEAAAETVGITRQGVHDTCLRLIEAASRCPCCGRAWGKDEGVASS